MLVVKFDKEIIEKSGRKYIPILDHSASLEELMTKLKELESRFKIKRVFLAGDSIVGSCACEGDYTALVCEIDTYGVREIDFTGCRPELIPYLKDNKAVFCKAGFDDVYISYYDPIAADGRPYFSAENQRWYADAEPIFQR